ncbi:phosphate acetyltransferase [Planctomycetaceae bacterium SH139]
MPDSLYLATNERATGKRMVALGLMELVSRRFERVAFFRPIVRESAEQDLSIQLLHSRYALDMPIEQMVGMNRKTAREFLAADRYEAMLQEIQQRYKALQENYDFVVVEGTSFQGLVPEIEFELNADIAVNLGCPIMSVYSAHGKSVEECTQSVAIGNDNLLDRRGQLFGTLINQVLPEQLSALHKALTTAGVDRELPVYVLCEDPLLRQPTLREIAAALDAKLLNGEEESLDREVTALKVAAMQLPDFLGRLQANSLIMTPGDRSDILIGCVLASLTKDTPAPAGVILTGGLMPRDSVLDLVRHDGPLPILVSADDTFNAATKASEVRAEISLRSPRKIDSAIGLFEKYVDTEQLAKLLQAPTAQRMTPMLFEYSLIRRASQQRVRIVLPEGTEPRILRAADIIRRRNVADLILLGDISSMHAAASQVGVSLEREGIELIDPSESPLRDDFAQTYYEARKHKGITLEAARDRMLEVSYFGTMMVHRSMAGGMVSGAAHTTANTIRPAFEFIKTKPGVTVVSSVFLMCLPTGVLVYGDCAVIPNPTAEQLVQIALSSAATAQQFSIDPRVAMLSYSTGASGQGEDVQRVREATRMLLEQHPDFPVEGPLQYDAAIDPAVAATKLPGSKIAGRATVFIFPDLNTGNNTYKAVQRSADVLAIGPILQGLRKPVNDLSRGCTIPDIVNTVAITAIQAQNSV